MNFQEVIKQYLDDRAAQDEQFAVTYAKENKSIEECCKYILGEARKLGNEVCMSDEEVYGLAVHYYDEDDIKIEAVPASFVSTPKVDLTEDDKELQAGYIALIGLAKNILEQCIDILGFTAPDKM